MWPAFFAAQCSTAGPEQPEKLLAKIIRRRDVPWRINTEDIAHTENTEAPTSTAAAIYTEDLDEIRQEYLDDGETPIAPDPQAWEQIIMYNEQSATLGHTGPSEHGEGQTQLVVSETEEEVTPSPAFTEFDKEAFDHMYAMEAEHAT